MNDLAVGNLIELAASISAMSRNASRLFLPFSQMNKLYLEEKFGGNANSFSQFIEWANLRYSDDEYSRIQRSHLSKESLLYIKKLNYTSPEHKYIDFPFWANSKFNVARRLGLHNKAGSRILDIGAGPGHFGVVAKFMGCDYLGLEVPLISWIPGVERHLFDDLCHFFDVKRITFALRPTKRLELDSRFNFVTCQMGTFPYVPSDEKTRSARVWSWEDWAFLLSDLIENCLTDDFQMYFQISRSYMPPEVWSEISRRAIASDEKNVTFQFDRSLVDRL